VETRAEAQQALAAEEKEGETEVKGSKGEQVGTGEACCG
jgi:hypothetical protein